MSSSAMNIDNQSSLLEQYKKNSVSKEIAKDIILHKIHKQDTSAIDGDLKYIFFVQCSYLTYTRLNPKPSRKLNS